MKGGRHVHSDGSSSALYLAEFLFKFCITASDIFSCPLDGPDYSAMVVVGENR
jgi:hypothetical protein